MAQTGRSLFFIASSLVFLSAWAGAASSTPIETVDCEGKKTDWRNHPLNHGEMTMLGLDGNAEKAILSAIGRSDEPSYISPLKFTTKNEKWIVVRQMKVSECRFHIFSAGKSGVKRLLELSSIGFDLLESPDPDHPDVSALAHRSALSAVRLRFEYRAGSYREERCEVLELDKTGKELPPKPCAPY